jgi:hypothetical protein
MLPQAAADHHQAQTRLANTTSLAAHRVWARMGDDFDASWTQIERSLVALVVAGQLAAANLAEPYMAAVLAETAQPDRPAALVRSRGFAGTAADGRPLAGLLQGAVFEAKTARTQMSTIDALAQGGRWLDMVTQTTIGDIARSAVTVGITVRPDIDGYIRSTGGKACTRCLVLSGKFFRYNTGFARHPRCHCIHTPTTRHHAGDFVEATPHIGSADLSNLELAATSTSGRRMPEQIVASTDDRAAAIAMLRTAGFAA